jgi:hypothetical protein
MGAAILHEEDGAVFDSAAGQVRINGVPVWRAEQIRASGRDGQGAAERLVAGERSRIDQEPEPLAHSRTGAPCAFIAAESPAACLDQMAGEARNSGRLAGGHAMLGGGAKASYSADHAGIALDDSSALIVRPLTVGWLAKGDGDEDDIAMDLVGRNGQERDDLLSRTLPGLKMRAMEMRQTREMAAESVIDLGAAMSSKDREQESGRARSSQNILPVFSFSR